MKVQVEGIIKGNEIDCEKGRCKSSLRLLARDGVVVERKEVGNSGRKDGRIE